MKKRKHDDASLSCSLIRRPIQRWGWLFLLPTFAAFCVGFLYPFAKGLFLSFCKFKTTSKWTWVGLKNYQTIFQDDGFLHAFWYTALFALVSLLIINVLAFAVAYVLTKGIKGSNIFRTVFFMPNLIGGIVLGYIWLMIFDGILSHRGSTGHPGGYARGRKDRRRFRLEDPLAYHHPERHAVHHHLHLPFTHQRLQAL